jgi:hypothetical protein
VARVNLRIRRKPSIQSRSKTSFGKFVRVAITQFDLDPTIFDSLVQPSLEIGISHIGEIMRRSTPLTPTLCCMKMLRIWRPTSSSDAMSHVLAGVEPTITQVEQY